jgi:transposase
MDEGLRSPEWQVTGVIALLSSGCPVQAIVQAFGLDERTVARWIERAGKHGEHVQSELIGQQERDLQQVQADEISVTCDKKVAWMAMAIMVSTRLWLGGVVSPARDHQLTDWLLRLMRATFP